MADRENNVFFYPNGIEELAEKFGYRSNSIASTYLTGLQNRVNHDMAEALEGSIVLLVQRNRQSYPFIGKPLHKDLFEGIAFRTKMLYSGDGVLIGQVTKDEQDEFAIQSANWIGNYYYFSLLEKGDA